MNNQLTTFKKTGLFFLVLFSLNILTLAFPEDSWGFEENFDVSDSTVGRFGPFREDGKHIGFYSPHNAMRAKMHFLRTGVSRLEWASQ